MISVRTKKIFAGIFFGALLVAGLFFFGTEKKPELKPSKIDFKESNRPIEKVESSPANQAPFQWPEDNSLNSEDQKKWDILTEILESKNDNDPRLDQELRHLSPQMHQKLRKAYDLLSLESRNERGTIAFLLARDLQTLEDAEFITEIYQEKPCLGFQDCTKEDGTDPHLEGINQTSLNYPQLAALYQLGKRLESNLELLKNPEMKKQISDLLREARQFPAAAVQKRAEDIQKQFGL
ncbi:MAG: hypothetical protein ACAH59_03070 [Pseudobdellovibrionaceae bacterium]